MEIDKEKNLCYNYNTEEKMSNDRDFIKEAEQNVLNRAREMDMSLKLFDSFAYKYSGFMPERHRKDFSEKMQEVRKVLYSVYAESITELFIFTGVGGEEATNYARDKMKERFKDEPGEVKYAVMGLLERNGKTSWYYNEDEENFRNQVNEKVKEWE